MGKVVLNTLEGRQEVEIDASLYQEAGDSQFKTVRSYMNNTHMVAAGEIPAFDQACAQLGMIVGQNQDYGIRPCALNAIVEGTTRNAGGAIVREAVPTSRILFPAFISSMVEDKLVTDRTSHVGVFNSMVALHDVINNDRIEWPEVNFSKPEAGKSRAIAQLSEPASMGTIKLSDRSFTMTGTSLGMEISDQAAKLGSSASLDFVALAIQRWMQVELGERVNGYIMALLNGDLDYGYGALSAISGVVRQAKDFDASITAAGVLTQNAWVKWLHHKRRTMTIDWIITDIDGALAIENRTGRPNVNGDNNTSPRINVDENVRYPIIPDNVNIFITDDPAWPANTLMGFDSQYAIHKITSTLLDYRAAEAYVMRRSTKFRIDSGEAVRRMHDDAYAVLTLTND